jgi:hypothetical protein
VLVGGPDPYTAGEYRRFRAQAEAHRAALRKWGFEHAVGSCFKLLKPDVELSFKVAGPRRPGGGQDAAALFGGPSSLRLHLQAP